MYKRLKEKKRKRKKENRWAVREIGDPVKSIIHPNWSDMQLQRVTK